MSVVGMSRMTRPAGRDRRHRRPARGPQDAEEGFTRGKEDGDEQRRERDAALEKTIEREQIAAAAPVGLPSAPPAAQREAAHEHADDGADRVVVLPMTVPAARIQTTS